MVEVARDAKHALGRSVHPTPHHYILEVHFSSFGRGLHPRPLQAPGVFTHNNKFQLSTHRRSITAVGLLLEPRTSLYVVCSVKLRALCARNGTNEVSSAFASQTIWEGALPFSFPVPLTFLTSLVPDPPSTVCIIWKDACFSENKPIPDEGISPSDTLDSNQFV